MIWRVILYLIAGGILVAPTQSPVLAAGILAVGAIALGLFLTEHFVLGSRVIAVVSAVALALLVPFDLVAMDRTPHVVATMILAGTLVVPTRTAPRTKANALFMAWASTTIVVATFLLWALRSPPGTARPIDPMTAPGLFTYMLSGVLVLTGFLFVRALMLRRPRNHGAPATRTNSFARD